MDKNLKGGTSTTSRNIEKKPSTASKPTKKDQKERPEIRTETRTETRVMEPAENSPPRFSNPSTPRNIPNQSNLKEKNRYT